jgi:hypothetical protein
VAAGGRAYRSAAGQTPVVAEQRGDETFSFRRVRCREPLARTEKVNPASLNPRELSIAKGFCPVWGCSSEEEVEVHVVPQVGKVDRGTYVRQKC